ncbi:transposase [Rhodanobacter sp. Si-c]|uniref:Transposase n=1 Tax=Rhodanobacter lycopersici TaxID=3162487 RepID=A0ABV3QBI8_9GAMM
MPRICNPAQHRLRVGRCSLPGQVYLLTTVTHQRRPVFVDTELARLAARCIGDAGLWAAGRCLCWVLMPDHWHGLVELGEGDDLARVMQRFKGVLSRRIGQQIRLAGPLWMHGYHDHALRRDEDLAAAARYVIANPVRAGLAACPLDWPYWDAWFVGDGPDCLL